MSLVRQHWFLLVVSLLGYVGLFELIGRVSGHGMPVIAIIPVLVIGQCWGWQAGLLAAVLSFPVNIFMMMLIGADWKHGMISGYGFTGTFGLMVIGFLIGYMRDMYLERKQINELLQQEIVRRTRDMDLLRSAEQRFQAIIQELADPIVVTGTSMSRITMVNSAFLELVGCTAEKPIGESLFEFMPVAEKSYKTVLGDEMVVDEKIYADMLGKMTELVEHGRVSSWEFFLLNSSGLAVSLEASAVYFHNVQGERDGAVVVLHDITERKRAERQMEESKNFLENIIATSLDGIIINDLKGHISIANQASADILGYTVDELRGFTPRNLIFFDEGWYKTTQGEQVYVSKADMMAVHSRAGELAKTGKIANYMFCVKRKDGRLSEVEANVAMLYNGQGAADGSVTILRDITTRKRMEHELVRQRDQLAATNQELESFSYSVSHDLRAPLRSISGFSAAIEDDFGGSFPPEVMHYLERIRTASGRMGLLIDDLLKLSRLTRYEMKRDTISLGALASDIAANLQEQEPGRSVVWDIQPGLVVLGDGRLLRIALENLIGNAWKYTGTRDRAEIFFGLDEAEHAQQEARGMAAYCVRDNGVGFDMAYADKLFGAFQRLHAEREFPGTGIGLATVQRIVHRHGGRVWASAAVDAGASFYFTLAQEG